MKRQGFLMLLFFIFAPSVFAQDIVTGNSSAKSSVETTVEAGSVKTHIEVEANGEKKTLETIERSIHALEVKSDANSNTEVSASASTERSKDEARLREEKSISLNMIKKFFKSMSTFFQKILLNSL